MPFTFPAETMTFLDELRRHNDRTWFEANRSRYEACYVEPAQAFVLAVAPALDDLVPGINAEPRILGSIFRINRDTRFGTDKRPYKDHLDFWFWEGDRKTAVSGLFARVSPDGVAVGAGAHDFTKDQLALYRASVHAPTTGAELATLVAAIEDAGHAVGGEAFTRTPRGFATGDDRERLLRHRALYVHEDLPASMATSPTLLPELLERWRSLAPLHQWLVRNVQSVDSPST